MTIAKKLMTTGGAEAVYVDDLFSTYLYEGNGTTTTVTNGLDLSGDGGLVWVKNRHSTATRNVLTDTERGAGNVIYSDSTSAEVTSAAWGVSSFSSTGFATSGSDGYNNSFGADYTSWSFRKQEGFFDVVTWTGDGTSDRAIPHSLGSEVGCILLKRTDTATDWTVYHRELDPTTPANYRMQLNENLARLLANSDWGSGIGTTPTDSEFTVHANTNINGATYVAYLFAHDAQMFGPDSDESIIKCGTFTTDGTGKASVDLGFEPQWMLAKTAEVAQDWFVYDNMRDWNATEANYLSPNTDGEELGTVTWCVTPTGFKIDPGVAPNRRYIYVAIRRPHKPAEEFAPDALFSTLTSQPVGTGNPILHDHLIDFAFVKNVGVAESWGVMSRMQGAGDMSFNSPNGESTFTGNNEWDFNEGFYPGSLTNGNYQSWGFTRAPGFLDVVGYKGDGAANQEIAHGLGAVPTMMWVRYRGGSSSWMCYHKDMNATNSEEWYAFLNSAAVPANTSAAWDNIAPTSTHFTVGQSGSVNANNGDHIAYLFGSAPGISHAGAYDGSTSDITVDCGFTNGARFVFIRRVDTGGGGGNWNLLDYGRGINASANEQAVTFNQLNYAPTDEWLDPHPSGFIAKAFNNESNVNGGRFIYYAIA